MQQPSSSSREKKHTWISFVHDKNINCMYRILDVYFMKHIMDDKIAHEKSLKCILIAVFKAIVRLCIIIFCLFFSDKGQSILAELPLQKSLGLNLSVAMFPKWPADPWLCLQTFVTGVSLSPQSHKAPSAPGWSREPRPKNRLSDKEPKAAGGLRIEKTLARSLVSTAGKMTSVSQSQKRFSVR